MNLVILAVVVAATLALSTFPIVKPVDWESELGDKAFWSKLCSFAAISSVTVTLLVGMSILEEPSTLRFAATVSGAGFVTLMLAFSAVTDFKVRLVDRRMNYFALAATAPLGVALAISEGAWIALSASVALSLFAAFLYLFALNSFGAGDVRALFLVALSILPVIGWNGFVWGSVVASITFILLGAGVAMVKRTTKASFPAVPMLIFPYWSILVLIGFTTLPAAFPAVAN